MSASAFFYLVSILAFVNAIRLIVNKQRDAKAERAYALYKARQEPKPVDVPRAGSLRADEREWGRESV